MGGGRSRAVEAALTEHQRDRERGGVVLSVLGAPAVASADFARWARVVGSRVILVDSSSIDDALVKIVDDLPAAAMLLGARRCIAEYSGRSIDMIDAALAARSQSEQRAWLVELARDPRSVAAAWVLVTLANGARLDARAAPSPLHRLVVAIVAFAGPTSFLVAPAGSGPALERAIGVAALLCELLAPSPVALAAQREDLENVFAYASAHASVTMARQGVVEVGPLEAPTASDSQGGRSRAERALHAALGRDARTKNRFALSHRLPIEFGGQPAEIDLYDNELALAIEIDGWHHFQQPDRYRRDRAKDVLLQREGILVLRVLEEDVWNRLDYLVEQIADLVSCRSHLRAC